MGELEIQCLCGATAVRLRGSPVVQAYCHCDDCQAAHSAAYILSAVYPAKSVEILKGNPAPLVIKTAPRMRCPGCGTFLFIEIPAAGLRSVNAMLLPKGQFKPQFHVQCQYAILPVVDDLPHFKGFPAVAGGSDELVEW